MVKIIIHNFIIVNIIFRKIIIITLAIFYINFGSELFLAAVRATARAAANGDGWDEVGPQAAGPFA